MRDQTLASPKNCRSKPEYVGPMLRAPLRIEAFPSVKIAPQHTVAPDLAIMLDKRFVQMVENQTDASSASIAIWHPDKGYWASSYGLKKDKPFWWASVGKMATATVIHQLIDEKRLSLDDKLSKWLSDFPNANLITIRQLLTHTSGVSDFYEDKQFREKRGIKTVTEILTVSAKHGSTFCPGTDWFYSNTGYILLGYIAEMIEDKPFAEIVEKRISEPLSLAAFSVISNSDSTDSIVAPKGTNAPSVSEIGSLYGAGALKSSPKDMMLFLSAFLQGNLTTNTIRDESLRTLYPMFGQPMNYGQGIMVYDVPDPDKPTVWLGHAGGSDNAKGLVLYDVERKAYVVVVLNQHAHAEAIANVLLKALD